MKPIWVVDDDQSIRFVLEKALARHNLPVRSFGNTRDVLAALQTDVPQVLVSDIRMPGGSGLDLLSKVRVQQPSLPVIIMTAYSDLDSAVSAFQGGAFEYLAKPFDVEKAVELIQRAVDESQREESDEESPLAMREMLGQAPAMQEVFRAIGKLSQSNVTVLITGESGTGKELVARALHKHSPRGSTGPFVAINTAAIPKDLLESELFGHERGAFTGAQAMRRGRFEQAEGGTLFLDEIGDMPFDLQTRLLRVLSDGHYYRVGGHSPIKANVRVIAATHQALEQRVKDGLFREDLFHRLNVIRLRLPRLAERQEDVPLLARSFLQKSAKELGTEAKRISDAAMLVLQKYDFPGNVRELENICHWLTVMAPAQVVEAKDLPAEVLQGVEGKAQMPHADDGLHTANASTSEQGMLTTNSSPASQAANAAHAAVVWEQSLADEAKALLKSHSPEVMDQLTRRFEAAVIRTALDVTKGRRIEAAQRLGIGRNTITRKISDLNLEADDE